MELFARIATWIVAALVGAVFGAAGTISYASMLAGFPVGIIVSLVGAVAIFIAVRLISRDRIAVAATAAGALGALALLSGTGPGGSVIVPADSPYAIVWSIGLAAAAVAVAAWPSAAKLRASNVSKMEQ